LTIAEAAKFLGVSQRTVKRLLKRGLLDSEQVSSKEIRRLVLLDSLEAYRAYRGLSLVELTKRVLDLERKVAWLMNQSKAGTSDAASYDQVMESLRQNHPEIYG